MKIKTIMSAVVVGVAVASVLVLFHFPRVEAALNINQERTVAVGFTMGVVEDFVEYEIGNTEYVELLTRRNGKQLLHFLKEGDVRIKCHTRSNAGEDRYYDWLFHIVSEDKMPSQQNAQTTSSGTNSRIVEHESELSELSLGNVRLGMKYDDVIGMFGTPTKEIDQTYNGRVTARYVQYGGTVEINFKYKSDGEIGQVQSILVVADNGWALPSGIKVGSKLTDAIKLYGKPQLHGKGAYGEYWKFNKTGGATVVASTNRYMQDINQANDSDTITSLILCYSVYSDKMHDK